MPVLIVTREPEAKYRRPPGAGPRVGSLIRLRPGETVFGRDPHRVNVHLPCLFLNRMHARVAELKDGWYVEDLGTRNHTILNGRVLDFYAALTDDDVIRLTEYEFLFRTEPPDAARWATPDVLALARGVSEDGDLGRLPILADALEEAGCADAVVLAHCRKPPALLKASWVAEMVLGSAAVMRGV